MDGHAGSGGERVPEVVGDDQCLVVQRKGIAQCERGGRFLAGPEQVVERVMPVFRE